LALEIFRSKGKVVIGVICKKRPVMGLIRTFR
jgi:hypothetical protein